MRFLVIFLVVVCVAGICWARREQYSGRQRLVGYWGQNGAGGTYPSNPEEPLDVVCRTTKFDIIVMAFVTIFWETRDKDQLPAWNFANHCSQQIPGHPFLLRCPGIAKGVGVCQGMGKKVLISLGGANADGNLKSTAMAEQLAQTIYDLFLGGNRMDGSTSLRPFGSAILDGVDLDIEGGTGTYLGDFIKKMRSLMDADQSRSYLLTGAPQCPYPEPYWKSAFNSGAAAYMDHLYIQYYNNPYCSPGTASESDFASNLKDWLRLSGSNGPLLFVGLPASPRASTGRQSGARYYLSTCKLKNLYQNVRNLPGVGGIMLWDASWDQNNVKCKQRYSSFAFSDLKGSPVTTECCNNQPQPPVNPPVNPPVYPPVNPPVYPPVYPPVNPPVYPPVNPPVYPPVNPPVYPPVNPPVNQPVCTSQFGWLPDPTNCRRYYRCNWGNPIPMSCGGNLAFDPQLSNCVYPENVPLCQQLNQYG